MIAGKRKTIGVFLCKAYTVFDNAVYHALEEEAHRLDYDVIIFTTVGFFSSQNEYDRPGKGNVLLCSHRTAGWNHCCT
jgi:hypothetical protein